MRPLITQHKLWGSSRLLSSCQCEALCVRVVCQIWRLEISTMADGRQARSLLKQASGILRMDRFRNGAIVVSTGVEKSEPFCGGPRRGTPEGVLAPGSTAHCDNFLGDGH
jgi:hypothetical protein